MDVHEMEAKDGVRMVWNYWPPTRLAAHQILLPLGALYTPLKKVKDLKLVTYEPVVCMGQNRQCGAIFNPFCQIDFQRKCWICPFCGERNAMSQFYAQNITEQQKPQECMYTTIEYIIPRAQVAPPCFLFVLDTALNNVEDESEFLEAKEALTTILQMMPPSSLVGFITYGTVVNVHELGFQELTKSYAFRGSKGYNAQQVATQLGIPITRNVQNNQATQAARSRFLIPISECEFVFNSILDDLQRDRWPTQSADKRATRATGSALSVAVGLLEATYANESARVVLLSSGPCTVGPGQIVSQEKAETMRSHQDLQKERPNTRYVKGACQFYAALTSRAIAAGHAVDIFANSLDQIGSHEMRVLCDRTGGNLVMADGFSTSVFKKSFQKIFSKVDETGHHEMGFNSRVSCITSKEFKISGAIGACCGTGKKNSCVGDVEVGESGTAEWRIGAMDPNSTIGFYFEIAENNQPQNSGYAGESAAYLQFQTSYHHPSGWRRLRVTTLARAFSDAQCSNVAQGFDQECAATMVTRNAMFQVESAEVADVLRRMDRVLIRLISRFANYNKDDPQSFRLSDEFTLFPQFMYYLRRSPFLDLFNCSPDETAFYRSTLLRESCMHSLVMIQPALMEYNLHDPHPTAVLLDSMSMKKDVILMMDTFFHVVIWRGQQIQQWYDAGYHEQEDFAHLKELLVAPAHDAKQILDERIPVPKFIQTAEGGSQARFLACRVNPSKTHQTETSTNYPQAQSSVVLTDDASLRVFMQALIKYAVAS